MYNNAEFHIMLNLVQHHQGLIFFMLSVVSSTQLQLDFLTFANGDTELK